MAEYKELTVQRDVPEWAHERWRVLVPADTPDEDLLDAVDAAIRTGAMDVEGQGRQSYVVVAQFLGEEHSEMIGPDSCIRLIVDADGRPVWSEED